MGTLGTPFAHGRLGLAAGRASLVAAPPAAPPAPLDPPPGGTLAAPSDLVPPAQSAFDVDVHVDGRGNWAVQGGRLACTGAVPGRDARLALPAPLAAGEGSYLLFDLRPGTAGRVKAQLGGDGAFTGRFASADWENFAYVPAAEAAGAYDRIQFNPDSAFDGSVDDVRLYPLGAVDPHAVACDVVLIGGDSNASNATSEPVTAANRETAFDPRIWTMPCLRSAATYDQAQAVRHVPMPAIEPVVGAGGARRMSPCHAAAARLVGWSAARGRPLLVMALGDAGSGLMNTEDWRHPARASGGNAATEGRMWGEMIAMKAALDALGPAHEIVGMIWSLGANDRFAAQSADAYDANHAPAYRGFFADLRTHVADVPMVLWNVGQHVVDEYAASSPGFGPHMQAFLSRLDMDSGHANAVPGLRVVQPPAGHELVPGDGTDPHYTAAGMQANGRAAGDALRALLEA